MYSLRRLLCILAATIVPAGLTQTIPRRLSVRQHAIAEWYSLGGSSPVGVFDLHAVAAGSAAIAPWGFNLSGRDLGVKPGDDFYTYAVGNYLQSFEIPADKSRYGALEALAEKADIDVKQILEEDEGKAGAYYKAFLNRSSIELLGIQPLKPFFKEIEKSYNANSLVRLAGKACESFYMSPFDLYVGQDARNPDTNVIHIEQGGLFLPTREYYLEDQYSQKKAMYQKFVHETLQRVKWKNAEKFAEEIVAFETQIAKASWKRADLRDPVKSYSSMTLADLKAEAPDFDWSSFLSAASVPVSASSTFVVSGKSGIIDISKVWGQHATRYESKLMLHAWQAFHVTFATSSILPQEYVDAKFEYSKSLSGAEQLPPLWKRGVSSVNRFLGEEVGKLYVEKHFPKDSKLKMDSLVKDLLAAHRKNLEGLTWMSSGTKKKALQKLSSFNTKIGHPATFKDYADLAVSPDDAFGNYLSAARFHWRDELKELGKNVDRDKWEMSPQTANAYYSYTMNEIVFPAAILQPPFFDPAADAAVNYGAIGAVIGREITHGFDDSGRHYNAKGKLEDWWTSEDEARFKVLAEHLGKQYTAFKMPEGIINAELTMGENIADNGGLRMALEAYHTSVGDSAPILDDLSGDQRFFLSWAQVWGSKVRAERAAQDLLTDVHSPPKARGTLPQCNLQPWYDAFEIKEGDKNYLAPADRVEIWYAGSSAPPVEPWPSTTPAPAPPSPSPKPHSGFDPTFLLYICGAVIALFIVVGVARCFRHRCFKRRVGSFAPDMEFGESFNRPGAQAVALTEGS